ncbi:MAG TPA: pseudouridine synthase [Candidatus Acidoferrum sp.]|nr:pseudouridine synthase [Candidatus Acidoferrum sp.]
MKTKRPSLRNRSEGEKHVGLARAISKLGHSSRTRAVALIRAGKVRVNGNAVRNPEAPVRLGRDRLEVQGREVRVAQKMYFMVNKPRGLVTTASDEKGRETVYALLPKGLPWVAPVGRLDQASEGLLLFTNDSEWAAGITEPESHVEKTYHVQMGVVADAGMLERLQHGVELPDGEVLKAKRVALVRAGEKNSWIEIVLEQGKNRQIRRMLDGVGVEVLRLVRVAVGPVQLGELAKGGYRALRAEERAALGRRARVLGPRKG